MPLPPPQKEAPAQVPELCLYRPVMGRWGPQPAHAQLWGVIRSHPCQFRTAAWRCAAFSLLSPTQQAERRA